MSFENPTPEVEKNYADIDVARRYGQSKMGEHGFDDFVSKLSAEDLVIRIINGRLATGNSGNVHIVSRVNTPEELALTQAGILQALNNKALYVATILTGDFDNPDLETSIALSQMRTQVFSSKTIDEENLRTYAANLPKSLLLVSRPDVLSTELSQARFGYRWHIELDLDQAFWRVGEVEVVTKFS